MYFRHDSVLKNCTSAVPGLYVVRSCHLPRSIGDSTGAVVGLSLQRSSTSCSSFRRLSATRAIRAVPSPPSPRSWIRSVFSCCAPSAAAPAQATREASGARHRARRRHVGVEDTGSRCLEWRECLPEGNLAMLVTLILAIRGLGSAVAFGVVERARAIWNRRPGMQRNGRQEDSLETESTADRNRSL